MQPTELLSLDSKTSHKLGACMKYARVNQKLTSNVVIVWYMVYLTSHY